MLFVPKADFKIAPVSALVFLAVILAFVCPALTVPASAADRGTITAFKLNIRSAPSTSAPVVATVDRGTQVEVIEVRGGIGGWVTLVYQGQKGYVRNRPRYIVLSASQSPGQQQEILVKKKGSGIEKKQDQKAASQHRAISEKIQAESQKMVRFSEKETEILNGLNQIDFVLNQARVRSQNLAKENQRLAHEIQSIQERIQTLTHSMDEVRGYAGQRLEALYRMHMMGSLEMAGPPSSLFDFFVTQRAMKQVVAADYGLLNTQAKDLAEMVRLKKALEEQIAAKTVLEGELAVQIRIKEKESRKKEMILKEIREKKKLSQAAIASLEQAAKALRMQLDAMGLSGSPALDDTSFVRQKGRLDPPVKGEVISRFGRSQNGSYKAFTFQSGIDIKVERGEPVRSVFKGEVMFSDWLQGYGNLLIVNHGDNYYTLYAHVEEIFKKKGDAVSTGEVIATAGDTGSIKGMCLHFEVRHHGKPVDPMTWLNKGA